MQRTTPPAKYRIGYCQRHLLVDIHLLDQLENTIATLDAQLLNSVVDEGDNTIALRAADGTSKSAHLGVRQLGWVCRRE